MKYYYVETNNPYNIKCTEILEDLILLLYNNTAQFISEDQAKDLNMSEKYLDDLRIEISKFKSRVPLYDIRSNHIFLIHRDNIYHSIYRDDYRFVDKRFYKNISTMKNPNKYDVENSKFLSYYNFNVLKQTYLKIFYKSFVINTYITNCTKPSFYPGMDHLSPYYNIDEINYLAYDWGLSDSITMDKRKLDILCKKISKHDIPAKTLINHQMYIYDSRAIGLVKHYSLFGSYYINKYLRYSGCCLDDPYKIQVIRNPYIENQANIMINLIKHAPAFSKEHTVYRFVNDDNYISNLKIGDIYQDNSFTSTTRNPFYCKENYKFGYILIKIKLPKNIGGIGICIEAYSNFPKEEEIILIPATRYRVDNIIDTDDIKLSELENYKFHEKFNLAISRKYELTWEGNDFIKSKSKNELKFFQGSIPEINEIDLQDILSVSIDNIPISQKIYNFKENYVNVNNQFISIISGRKYTFVLESYDSSNVYLPFFFYELKDGIMITTSNPKKGNINMLIELGIDLHVNYYFKYSVTEPSSVVNLNNIEWIRWLSMLAYIIGSRFVFIHSNYILLPSKSDQLAVKIQKTKHTFPENIYRYMKYGEKMYEFFHITAQFDYPKIDKLKLQPINEVIFDTDKNELYRVSRETTIDNMYDFYIYIVENFPNLINAVHDIMDRIYDIYENPFINMNYKLDAWGFLYQEGYIKNMPLYTESSIRKGSFKKMIGDKKIPKFKNRLRNLIRDVEISKVR